MAYENIPAESAPALRAQQPSDYTYTLDLMLADIDDIEVFDIQSGKGFKDQLDLLDRIVTKVLLRGQQVYTRKVTIVGGENGESDTERVDLVAGGVRGKGIPLPFLIDLSKKVGAELKQMFDQKN